MKDKWWGSLKILKSNQPSKLSITPQESCHWFKFIFSSSQLEEKELRIDFSDQKLNLVSENDLRGFAHHIGHLSNLNISHFWNQSYQLKHWNSRGKENVLKKNSLSSSSKPYFLSHQRNHHPSCTLLKNFPLWASPIVRLTGASDMDLPNYVHIFHQKEKIFFLSASSLLRGSTQN